LEEPEGFLQPGEVFGDAHGGGEHCGLSVLFYCCETLSYRLEYGGNILLEVCVVLYCMCGF
jgi:hypothetical protein